MNKKELLIRVDASPQIGIGHFMRTLALAQAWHRAGHGATFITREIPSNLAHLWEPFGVVVMDKEHEAGSKEDVDVTIEIAQDIDADYVVIDGHQFGSEYQKAIYVANIKQLFIDDIHHCDTYWANKIINPNVHANKFEYTHIHYPPAVLGGTRYAMLRQQFCAYTTHRPTTPDIATNVLVTMGGGDSGMLMSRILDALGTLNTPFNIVALVNSKTENLYHMTQLPQVTLLSEVYDVASLMENAHIAISSGGTTVWELAYMGVPSICISRGKHEWTLVHGAADRGIVIDAGLADELYPSALAVQTKRLAIDAITRKKMSNFGQAYVDGMGAERVIDIMLEDINAEG